MNIKPKGHSENLLILIGSPRREGNSAVLAESVKKGAEQVGTKVTLCYIDDYIKEFLKDCRLCRLPNGECSIEDDHRSLFMQHFLPADGVVFCTPVYWYGMSAQMKAFFDRSFCYYAGSYPKSGEVIRKMSHKRIGLVVVSEETFPGISISIIHQLQEYTRYTHSEFVGTIHGYGNSRGEVANDPNSPISNAVALGRGFFKKKYSDYQVDTERNGKVW